VAARRFGSAWTPLRIAFEIALPSRSTMLTEIRARSPLRDGPEKIEPKNDAMAIGTAKLMITARRSLKKSWRSLRIIATRGVKAISRASSFR
jgi:hypothetical protein